MKTDIKIFKPSGQLPFGGISRTLTIVLALSLYCLSLQAQTRRDTLRQYAINRLNRQYGVAPASAAQFMDLEANYRASYLQILNDRSTSDHNKAVAIDQLMHNKNTQLARLLTPEQTLKLVPLREITRNTDSLILLNGIRYFVIKLDADIATAGKLNVIYQSYARGIDSVGRDDSKSVAEATDLVTRLRQQQYLQLKALLPADKLNILYPIRPSPKDIPVIPKEVLAVAESFDNKMKLLVARTDLSPQAKQAAITELQKTRLRTLQKMVAAQRLGKQ